MASAKAKTEDMGAQKGQEKDSPSNGPSFNMDEIRELADLVDERGFTDFEFENEKIRVRLSKAVTIAAPAIQEHAPQPAAAPVADTALAAEPVADEGDGLATVNSPIVGTFYRSPAPEKPSYVKEGDVVSADSVVCIVEAMKLMNEIQAEIAGEIVKIYVENGQPVEYGQPLFGIKQ
jgi:acetyl-CoA carboxylase biotin carboxyl carrier protein